MSDLGAGFFWHFLDFIFDFFLFSFLVVLTIFEIGEFRLAVMKAVDVEEYLSWPNMKLSTTVLQFKAFTVAD